jgi:hypothetical protein
MSPNHASNIPLVLSTTTGLVSPQFHVIYDNSFTTTTCLADNKLPTNWNNLLTTSSEKLVDKTFNSTICSDTSWFSPNSMSTDQSNLPSNTDLESPTLQREDTSSNQREGPLSSQPIDTATTPSSPTANRRSGWNSNHQYNTRFRRCIQAFTASPATDNLEPLSDNFYTAFISSQDSYPIQRSSALQHFACATQSNPTSFLMAPCYETPTVSTSNQTCSEKFPTFSAPTP